MSRDQINQLLLEVSNSYPDRDNIEDIANFLIKLHNITIITPAHIAQHIKFLSDEEIYYNTIMRSDDLIAMKPPKEWCDESSIKSIPSEEIVKQLFLEIRCIDKLLFELRDPTSRVEDPNEEFFIKNLDSYLIPIAQIKHNQKSISRSALVYHRIIPAHINGIKIKIYNGPDLYVDQSQTKSISGIIFNNYKLEIIDKNAGKSFLIADVICNDYNEQINNQFFYLENSQKQLAVIWPELMASTNMRNTILERSAKWPLVTAPNKPILMVPGSWHENQKGNYVNRCYVYNGHGDELFSYDKRMIFSLKGKKEHIEPGTEIPIMILGNRLLCFAICLDFCDGMHNNPYIELAVDIFIVPALGEKTTIDAHKQRGKDVYLKHGSKSFIVQQNPDSSIPDAVGYIMLFPEESGDEDQPIGSGVHFRTV